MEEKSFITFGPGPFPNDFPWYFEALRSVEASERKEKERRLGERPTGTKIRVLVSTL